MLIIQCWQSLSCITILPFNSRKIVTVELLFSSAHFSFFISSNLSESIHIFKTHSKTEDRHTCTLMYEIKWKQQLTITVIIKTAFFILEMWFLLRVFLEVIPTWASITKWRTTTPDLTIIKNNDWLLMICSFRKLWNFTLTYYDAI